MLCNLSKLEQRGLDLNPVLDCKACTLPGASLLKDSVMEGLVCSVGDTECDCDERNLPGCSVVIRLPYTLLQFSVMSNRTIQKTPREAGKLKETNGKQMKVKELNLPPMQSRTTLSGCVLGKPTANRESSCAWLGHGNVNSTVLG